MKGLSTEHEYDLNVRRIAAKKAILLILILAVTIFVFIQRDNLRDSKVKKFYRATEQTEVQHVSILGDHDIEQVFMTRAKSYGVFRMKFYNPARGTATGTIHFILKDDKGKEVASTEIDASLALNEKYTRILFGGDSEALNANRIVSTTYGPKKSGNISVTEDRPYTLEIITEDVASEDDFDILILTDPDFDSRDTAHDIVVDGRSYDNSWIYGGAYQRYYDKNTLKRLMLLFLAAIILVLLPYELIDRKVKFNIGKFEVTFSTLMSAAMFVVTPLVSYYIIELYDKLTPEEFAAQLHSDAGLGAMNLMILGFILWIFYTITNSTKAASALTAILASGFGLLNYALLQFRDSPFIAADIMQTGTAIQVAGAYSIVINSFFLNAVLVTVLWCAAALAPAKHQRLSLRMRLIPLLILVLYAGAFRYVFFTSTVIEDKHLRVSGFKPKKSYSKNGSALSFTITIRNSIIRAPKDYSPDITAAAADRYQSDPAITAEEVSEKTPNVIVIMNEAFSDLSVLGEIETNEDYMPYFRDLEQKSISGWMEPSSFGGSTANTEFEYLTGFSMRYLPFQSIAYRIIRNETPSFADYMKTIGYGGAKAFHPGMNNSYNRNRVYPLLGFNDYISFESLEEPEMIRDFTSDKFDYSIIEDEYENFRKESPEQPFFMFNVTIQNHGGYTLKNGVVDAGIEVKAQDNEDESVQQYLNLIKLSDEALEDLINYYENTGEETVIIMFGDHQPRVGDEFYNNMKKQHPEMSELEWADLQHHVPFLIWSNYDLKVPEELKGEDGEIEISANYMATYLKTILGLPLTGFDKYLKDLSGQIPVINAICFKSADGTLYDPAQESPYDDVVNEYQNIQYNGLIDIKHRNDEFFRLKPQN